MYVAALLLMMFPLLTGFQRCGPSPRMLYISRKESPELNITHLRDRSQSFFFESFTDLCQKSTGCHIGLYSIERNLFLSSNNILLHQSLRPI